MLLKQVSPSKVRAMTTSKLRDTFIGKKKLDILLERPEFLRRVLMAYCDQTVHLL